MDVAKRNLHRAKVQLALQKEQNGEVQVVKQALP
jgi:hypothetical protein